MAVPCAPDHAGALRLFLPGAFAGPLDDLARLWQATAPDVALDFHPFVPSGILAREILDGAPADVYVSANRRFMDEVWEAGLVAHQRRLAGNRLCIIVRRHRAADVRSLPDLCRPGLRVVTPQSATDPCGQYIVELWERAGLGDAMSTKEARGELIHSVGSGDLPRFLGDGRADAGVFYASEARSLGDAVATVFLPPELDFHERIAFWIGTVARAGRRHPAGDASVDLMTSAAGQDLLVTHGFLPAASSGNQH